MKQFFFHLNSRGDVQCYSCGNYKPLDGDSEPGVGKSGWYFMHVDEDFIEFWSRLEKIRE